MVHKLNFRLIANHAHLEDGGTALLQVSSGTMSKKNKSKYGAGQAVHVEVITMKPIDCSSWIDDPENWTRGPVLPVGAVEEPAKSKRSAIAGRKKRGKR